MIADRLVNYTASRLNKAGTLTWSFRRGDVIPQLRQRFKDLIADLDESLPGIRFRKIKPSTRTDLLIGYGDIPDGAAGAAVWTDVRWEIRVPPRVYAAHVFRHELGHVLGLDHVPMGSRSIMAPSWNGYSDFTRQDMAALQAAWA